MESDGREEQAQAREGAGKKEEDDNAEGCSLCPSQRTTEDQRRLIIIKYSN